MSESMILGLVFGGVGLLLIVLALFFLIRTRMFISNSRETMGTVTQMVYDSDSEGGGYTPMFQFQ